MHTGELFKVYSLDFVMRDFKCDFIGYLCVSVQEDVPEGLKSSSYKVLESHIVYIAHIRVAGW